MCGEKYCCTLMACRNWGSPPRMRGKAQAPARQSLLFWITPAYAGKRKTAWKGEGKKQDHPRVCGEKLWS